MKLDKEKEMRSVEFPRKLKTLRCDVFPSTRKGI